MSNNKPCPFCGEAEVDAYCEGATDKPFYVAYCCNCEAQGPALDAQEFFFRDDIGLPAAIEKWNTRAA